MSRETQICPFCAETIKAEAIVCRYCGRDLPAASGLFKSSGSVEKGIADSLSKTRKQQRNVELIIAYLPLAIVFILLITNPSSIWYLFKLERPFIIEPFLPCGWVIIFTIGGLLVLANLGTRWVHRLNGQEKPIVWHTTRMFFWFLFFLAIFLILVAPNALEIIRTPVF